MSKNVAAVRVVEPDDASEMSGLSDEVVVALGDIAAVAREGLLALSVSDWGQSCCWTWRYCQAPCPETRPRRWADARAEFRAS